jgi:general secretion pathway protein G
MRRLLRDQRGFSLIELLVVIIILGLIAGLVGPRLFGRVGQSKHATSKAQVELFGAALDQYRLDVGAYPPSGAGLQALVQNPNSANWNGPYLKKPVVPLDPWGRPYQYKCCGRPRTAEWCAGPTDTRRRGRAPAADFVVNSPVREDAGIMQRGQLGGYTYRWWWSSPCWPLRRRGGNRPSGARRTA